MRRVFQLFTKMLSQRLKNKALIKEDEVRYTLFHALTTSKFSPHYRIRIESPHSRMKGKEVDTVVRRGGKCRAIAFEFKYDKQGKGALNRPERAGSIFRDIFRLASLPRHESYFIYITDTTMKKYFTNSRNKYGNFFDPPKGPYHFHVSKAFIAARPRSFKNELKGNFHKCELEMSFRKELSNKLSLRIFKIL